MIRSHRDAVIAWLEERLPGAVFTSYSAADRERYAVVFLARARRDQARYTGPQSRDTFTVTIHSVGRDENLSLWVQERVDGLTGVTLSVPGRKLRPALFITGTEPDLDDDGPRPLWFTVSQFDIISDPA